jgi:uncharacterized membrane protein YdjX (TVP38/TMEM64 family)
MPFGVIHVASAAFGVPLRTFTTGTAIGMVPCVFLYGLLGAQLARVAAAGKTLDVATFVNPSVGVPLFGLAALALIPALIREVRARMVRA